MAGNDEGPSRPRGKGATTSVRRLKEQELEAQGGRRKRRRAPRTQPQPEPQPEPQGDPEPAADPHPEDIDIDDVGEPQPGTPAHGRPRMRMGRSSVSGTLWMRKTLFRRVLRRVTRRVRRRNWKVHLGRCVNSSQRRIRLNFLEGRRTPAFSHRTKHILRDMYTKAM
ncbi:hypothetical protein A2U01_0009070 [Trifolium medium]|uniref:Uncharacterized protein n=1 Tax=Trifolium medium TaxID=97028 RepID=A0A392ML18_9FABA|nr:hypothetical protein [Trifolium medium]